MTFSLKRILYLLLGVAAIVFGILCIFNENLPMILAGIALILYGGGGFFHWRERRKAGAAGIWALFGMLLAVIFGIIILIGHHPGEHVARFVLIVLSIWLMAEGVLEFLGAVMYRKAMTTADLGVQAPGSLSSMVLGIVMIGAGILGLIFPVFAEVAAWIWIVLVLILSGVRLIWRSRSAGMLEESII